MECVCGVKGDAIAVFQRSNSTSHQPPNWLTWLKLNRCKEQCFNPLFRCWNELLASPALWSWIGHTSSIWVSVYSNIKEEARLVWQLIFIYFFFFWIFEHQEMFSQSAVRETGIQKVSGPNTANVRARYFPFWNVVVFVSFPAYCMQFRSPPFQYVISSQTNMALCE